MSITQNVAGVGDSEKFGWVVWWYNEG